MFPFHLDLNKRYIQTRTGFRRYVDFHWNSHHKLDSILLCKWHHIPRRKRCLCRAQLLQLCNESFKYTGFIRIIPKFIPVTAIIPFITFNSGAVKKEIHLQMYYFMKY